MWPPSTPPATRRRCRGRGVESEEVALERGRLDAVIAGLVFMARMWRSEVSPTRHGNGDGPAARVGRVEHGRLDAVLVGAALHGGDLIEPHEPRRGTKSLAAPRWDYVASRAVDAAGGLGE